MNHTVVIFESRYGSARRYAEWIAKALDCPVFKRKDFPPRDFARYDIVIYGGGLYAGGLSGIRSLTKNWPLLRGKKVILFTCGLSDPKNPANTARIRESLNKTLPREMQEQIHLFHFRGGISYPALSPMHRLMMSMLRKMLLKKAPSEYTAEDEQLLETYGKTIDFTSREQILPLVEFLRK